MVCCFIEGLAEVHLWVAKSGVVVLIQMMVTVVMVIPLPCIMDSVVSPIIGNSYELRKASVPSVLPVSEISISTSFFARTPFRRPLFERCGYAAVGQYEYGVVRLYDPFPASWCGPDR